jgi:hypothetical protein
MCTFVGCPLLVSESVHKGNPVLYMGLSRDLREHMKIALAVASGTGDIPRDAASDLIQLLMPSSNNGRPDHGPY